MGRRVPAALLLLLGTAPAAWADGPLHVDHALLACVDPEATRLLSDRTMLHRSGWSDAIRRNGRCFTLTPRLQLEAISRAHALVLVRRVPPHVGEPPLYVLASTLRNGAPARAAPKRASPTPAQAAAATPPAPALDATPPTDTPAPTQAAAPATAPAPAATPATPPPADTPAPAPASTPAAPPAATSPAATPPAATPAPDPIPTAPPPTTASPAADTPTPDPSPAAALPTPAQPAPGQPAPVWPPSPDVAQRSSGGFWYGVAVTLLLLLFVLAAFLVARRRRHFAHVEEGWPPAGIDLPDPVPAAAPNRPMLPPREFTRRCVKDLEFAGWTMQPAFAPDGGPDLVGRRDGTLLAVRCRQSLNPITSEMVDEAARMATRPAGALTAIVSNAPFSARARDEAGRQGILLLRDTELSGFTG